MFHYRYLLSPDQYTIISRTEALATGLIQHIEDVFFFYFLVPRFRVEIPFVTPWNLAYYAIPMYIMNDINQLCDHIITLYCGGSFQLVIHVFWSHIASYFLTQFFV